MRQLTLGEKAPPNGTRITVKCGTSAGAMAVVGHIRVGAVETINLNSLEFPGGLEVKFEISVQGKGAEGAEVHVAGFFEGMDTGEQYGEEGDSDEDPDADSEGGDSMDEMDGVMGDEQVCPPPLPPSFSYMCHTYEVTCMHVYTCEAARADAKGHMMFGSNDEKNGRTYGMTLTQNTLIFS